MNTNDLINKQVIKIIYNDIKATKLDIHNLKLKSGRPEDLASQHDYLINKLLELELELSTLQ